MCTLDLDYSSNYTNIIRIDDIDNPDRPSMIINYNGSPIFTIYPCGDLKQYIYNRMRSSIPDSFARKIKDSLQENYDIIYWSKEPQVGKTVVILINLWLWNYERGTIPILILNDSLQDIYQIRKDIDDFNYQIQTWIESYDPNFGSLMRKFFNLDIFEIESQTPDDSIRVAIHERKCLLMTLNVNRYEKIIDIINKTDNCTIIYDEADLSVGTGDKGKEKIFRTLTGHHGNKIRIIYITATPFAIENCYQRTETRRITSIMVPENIYESKGCEYRGFRHQSNEFVYTDCIRKLRQSWTKNDRQGIHEALEDMSNHLRILQENPKTINQPNIVLINVYAKNEPKLYLADELLKIFGNTFHIVINIGDGLIISHIDNTPGSDGNIVRQNIKNTTISAHLQTLKDHGQMKPIIIIATKKASRAQRYKSTDHQWKLTHYFLDFCEKIHVESLVQVLRGNGQYRPEAPNLTYYMTETLKDLIEKSIYTKGQLSLGIEMYPKQRPRDLITKIPIVSLPIKMTRPGLDDTKSNVDLKSHHGEFYRQEDAEEAINYINRRFNLNYPVHPIMTDLHFIPRSDFLIGESNNLTALLNILRNPSNSDEPFHNIPTSLQSTLRQFIIQYSLNNGWLTNLENPTCQICYSSNRYKQLNKFEGNKSPNFKADIICIHPSLKGNIPVVVYRNRDIQAYGFYMWHTPEGKVRYYLYSPNSNLINSYIFTNLKR